MTELVIGMVLGMIMALLGVYLYFRMIMRRAEHNIERLQHVIDQLQASTILARVEESDGIFYVYDTKDSTFMAQGTSIAEIRHRIEERWHDAIVHVTEGDRDVIERLKKTAA